MKLIDAIWCNVAVLSESADNLTTATLSAMNMEALLETEDDLACWDADRLMLEIDDALSDVASSSDKTTLFSPRDMHTLSDMPAGDLQDGIHRGKRTKDSSSSASAKSLRRSNSLPTSLEADEFGMPLAIFTKVWYLIFIVLLYFCCQI